MTMTRLASCAGACRNGCAVTNITRSSSDSRKRRGRMAAQERFMCASSGAGPYTSKLPLSAVKSLHYTVNIKYSCPNDESCR
ncbi:hypothetical protein MPC4_30200 [Methylocella tundrae]|uniref:Uncharacterized protein n=1 Tax=Methylocella tundrae TaxID=227605 RepID=A0A8B6M833_METTU|nr:hypothetical protein MPC1_7960002 [Methylocella tundrae]VTZ51016.1 hypothetical protein MPC4_30200 [Methylocella tundrae]